MHHINSVILQVVPRIDALESNLQTIVGLYTEHLTQADDAVDSESHQTRIEYCKPALTKRILIGQICFLYHIPSRQIGLIRLSLYCLHEKFSTP